VATEAAFARAFDEELDYYGIVPYATLLPASFVTARRERLLALSAPVVSSIISQIARLVQSSCYEFSDKVPSPTAGIWTGIWPAQLMFFLSDPNGTSWSEASVRLVDGTDQASLREIYQIVSSYADGAMGEQLRRASDDFSRQPSLQQLVQMASHIQRQQPDHPRLCPRHVQAALQTRLESLGYKAGLATGGFLTLSWYLQQPPA
jgi:hypothetical protein